jgi:predicted DNA-binding protein
MKQAHRFFNLLLPFKVYEELKLLSVETDRSVAEIVRQAISLLLEKTKNAGGINPND